MRIETVFKSITQAQLGENVCIKAMIAADAKLTHIRKGLDIVRFRAVDQASQIEITYFNQSYLKDTFKAGQVYAFYGKVEGD